MLSPMSPPRMVTLLFAVAGFCCWSVLFVMAALVECSVVMLSPRMVTLLLLPNLLLVCDICDGVGGV